MDEAGVSGGAPDVPVIDIGALVAARAGADGGSEAALAAGRAIDAACRDVGFFAVVGHGVDPSLLARLDGHARGFFALPEAEKGRIAMARAGRAWRGWFPVGGELTSGAPDLKEGLYFGAELAADDPRRVRGPARAARCAARRQPAGGGGEDPE